MWLFRDEPPPPSPPAPSAPTPDPPTTASSACAPPPAERADAIDAPQPPQSLPVLGVLCVDHGGAATATTCGSAGFILAYTNTGVTDSALHAVRSSREGSREREKRSAGVRAKLRAAVESLQAAHGDALLGIAYDALFALCDSVSLLSAVSTIAASASAASTAASASAAASASPRLFPSALLQAPAVLAAQQPHETLLVLVDTTGFS